MAPAQLSFFQGLGFSQPATTLALVGHVPGREPATTD